MRTIKRMLRWHPVSTLIGIFLTLYGLAIFYFSPPIPLSTEVEAVHRQVFAWIGLVGGVGVLITTYMDAGNGR